MTTYTTKDGDTVDYITWKFYGFQDKQAVEQVLLDNPGIADIGPLLPRGMTVNLPDLSRPATVVGVRLWD